MERVALETLAERFDAFLIDQYGVLRDDSAVYPLAPAALASLRGRGKRVIILSNSGRSAADNALRLAKTGIATSLYDHFVTSGEVAYRLLPSEGNGDNSAIFEIASGHPTDLPERLGRPRCDAPMAAGLILISGAETERVHDGRLCQLLAGPAAAQNPGDLHQSRFAEDRAGRGLAARCGGAWPSFTTILAVRCGASANPNGEIYDHALALIPESRQKAHPVHRRQPRA